MTLTAETILAALDSSAASIWPDFWGITMTEYHALRLIAVRSRSGDDWGLVFDCIRGSSIDDTLVLGAGVWRLVYGSRVKDDELPIHYLPLVLPEDRDFMSVRLEGLEIDGPAGKLRTDEATLRQLDLRPGFVCNNDGSSEHPIDVQAIRAYLAEYPGSLWPPAAESAALLNIDDGEILVVSDAFAHVLGPSIPMDRDDLAPLAVLPSASPTYRSLAEAIATRDASRFVPGESNLDWRRWAVQPDDNVDLSTIPAAPTRQ